MLSIFIPSELIFFNFPVTSALTKHYTGHNINDISVYTAGSGRDAVKKYRGKESSYALSELNVIKF